MKWLGELISRLRTGPAKNICPKQGHANMDEAEISLFGLDMILKRKFYLDTPHEVSLFVPRAEIRQTTYEGENKRTETEMILNSITIVHAPMHPLAGEPETRPPGQAKVKIPLSGGKR